VTNDTIAAIATAPGQGGVSIVRVSGPDAEKVLLQVFKPAKAAPLASHMLTYGHVVNGNETIDECMAVIMRAPRSYTRDDVAELQLHGGGYTCQRVLALCLQQGADRRRRCQICRQVQYAEGVHAPGDSDTDPPVPDNHDVHRSV
jgi:tRNA modification GTPase